MTSILWVSRGEHKLQATFRAAIWVLRGMKTGDEFSDFFWGLLRAQVCLRKTAVCSWTRALQERTSCCRHGTCFHQPRMFCCRQPPTSEVSFSFLLSAPSVLHYNASLILHFEILYHLSKMLRSSLKYRQLNSSWLSNETCYVRLKEKKMFQNLLSPQITTLSSLQMSAIKC